MTITRIRWTLLSFCLFLFTSVASSQMVDLSGAEIISVETKDPVLLKSIDVLTEEIQKRTSIQLPVRKKWVGSGQTIIAIGQENDTKKYPENIQRALSAMPAIEKEGYKIIVNGQSNVVAVVGADPRGVLYGIGKLLRSMEMRQGQILIADDFMISSSPAYPIRGHQLGYRPKTNAYDAWSPEQFDRYIRDLAIFGANSIEIMPPRTDDAFTSVHMKLPAKEMMVEQSRICDSYGIDVWMWYPNLGSDYGNPDSLQRELEERHAVFKSLPRLDALFVPGGDPGDLEPDALFDFLQKEAEVLHQYHPNAKIWVSPQVFKPTRKWLESFYGHVNRKYDWFGGVVFGPWIKTPIEEVRKLVNSEIPIRRYPDITHNIKCQYPIPNWDLAYANTLERESVNPRPIDQKKIHNAFAKYAQGSISYSEGINDDVNKMIWSDQDWNPESSVIETLHDYVRYFISADLTGEIAQGIMALEENLRGPLLANDGVVRTLHQWQAIEKNAPDEVLSNYRFQMGLIRAYYDAYQYRRLIYETDLEQQARDALSAAPLSGSSNALNKAREILSQSWKQPVLTEWRDRCHALADSLFKNIGAQLTIEKHHGVEERGNFIDKIDLPLNDALWFLHQFTEIENMDNEDDQLAAIHKILHRTDPGPGGFYDNFGSTRSWSKVKSDVTWEQDPGTLISPRVSFGVGIKGLEGEHKVKSEGFEGKSWPLAWMNQATALYDQPLEIEYNNLDPNSNYTIRVAYTGRFSSRMRMVADDLLVHDFIQTGIQPIYEFQVPKEAVSDGKVTFKWTCGEGERGSQVSEIWLMK